MRRGVGERRQPVAQRLQPRDLARLDRRPRRRRDGRTSISARRCARQNGRAGRRIRPVVIGGQPDDGLDGPHVGRGDPLARRAGGRPPRVGDPPRPRPAACGRGGLHVAQPRHERRPQQDRRPEAARPGPVRVEHRPRVARTEPPRLVERLAERDVVDALGQDRLEVRGIGPAALPAQRAAGQAERVGEVDVGAGAHAERGHRRHGGARPRRCVDLDGGPSRSVASLHN